MRSVEDGGLRQSIVGKHAKTHNGNVAATALLDSVCNCHSAFAVKNQSEPKLSDESRTSFKFAISPFICTFIINDPADKMHKIVLSCCLLYICHKV